MRIADFRSRLNSVKAEIERLARECDFGDSESLGDVYKNYNDPDEAFECRHMESILGQFVDACEALEYMNQEITAEGYLYKGAGKKYYLKDKQFSCGYRLEVYIWNDDWDWYEWRKTRVEHDGKDYYLVGMKDISMEGLKARVRW